MGKYRGLSFQIIAKCGRAEFCLSVVGEAATNSVGALGQHMSRDDLGGAIILGYMRGGCCPIVAKCLENAMKVEFSRREFEAAAG